MENRQREKDKKRKFKKIYIALPILLLIVILGGAAGSTQVYKAKYHDYTSLAQTGIQDLRTAATLLETLPKNPLDTLTVSKAEHEFSAASTAFGQLGNNLNSLPGVSTYIPIYGARLSSALRLLPLTIEVSQAGVTSCAMLDLLISRIRDPLNVQGGGLTMADLAVVDKDLHQVKAILNQAIDQVNHLQPEDFQLDPRVRDLVATFHKDIPTMQEWLDNTEKLLSVAPTLLGIGTPANYLVEVLDSTELRPGGGFIGNYGIATVSGGRLTTAHITDTYLLDIPFVAAGHSIPYPSAYNWFDIGGSSWGLRDSNLDADFPTAARYGEMTYKEEGGKGPVQGVIAITPALIQHALAITGPIDVPEYHETVTVQNLIDRIHYHQLGPTGDGSSLVPGPDGLSSARKHFTALLAEHFLARVRQLSPAALSKLLQLLVASIHSKDIQIYLNSDIAENLLRQFHLDGSIQAPKSDSLVVVNANISPNKASSLVVNTLNDRVVIDAHGNATHYTSVSYAWTLAGKLYGSSVYRDYVRVYVPPGSVLQAQNGWEPRGTGMAFGREVWAGFFTFSPGQTHTITLTWTTSGAAGQDTHGWHYHYLIQRQAGLLMGLHLQVTLPRCAVIIDKSTGMQSSKTQSAVLAQSLNGDVNIAMDYTC